MNQAGKCFKICHIFFCEIIFTKKFHEIIFMKKFRENDFNFLVKSFSRKISWKFNFPRWAISSKMILLFLKSQSSAILPTLSQAKRPKNRQNFIVAELGKVQDDLVMAVLCSWQSSSSNSEASSSKIVNVTCCRTFA